jgi:glutamyl-tRNA synthetase
LLKDRSETLAMLAEEAMMFYGQARATPELLAQHVTAEIKPAMHALAARIEGVGDWKAEAITQQIKAVLEQFKLKMPKLAVPVRVAVFGRPQTPDLAVVLCLAGRDRVVSRLREAAS